MEDIIIISLFVILFLAALVFLLRTPYRLLKILISQAWRSRADLNPLTHQGRWRLLGLALIILGGLGVVQSLGVAFEALDTITGLFLFILSLGPLYVGFRCLGYAKRFDAVPAPEILLDDTRAPVLYLRSFEDDAIVARRMDVGIGTSGVQLDTEEGEIAAIVSGIGPLVAIGRPGEDLPYFGAAREYVGEADWHECVRILLARAPLVIIRAGDTPGLWWELEESVRTVKPRRLVFLIPLKRRQYEKFRLKAQKYLPCRLPEYAGRRIPATSLRAVLFFDSNWTPHLLPVQETLWEYCWRANFGGIGPSDLSVLRRILLVVLGALGLQWVDLSGRSNLRRVLQKTLAPVLQREFDDPNLMPR